jgi:shikimate dehydrogenase
MYHFGLVGYPLEHSLSPRIQHHIMRIATLAGEYRLYPVLPTDIGRKQLEALLQRLRNSELKGLNVTIPYKQTIIEYLDKLSPAAEAIGAVNTIYLSSEELCGENTDAPGFRIDLAELYSPESNGSETHRALILGAGGASRAVVYELMTCGWHVVVASRNPDQGLELVRHIATRGTGSWKIPQLKAIDLQELPGFLKNEENINLVVNATPVGMYPQVENCLWPESTAFPRDARVYDLVYNPPETVFLSKARQAGCITRNGWGMLVAQALLAFEKWTGVAVSWQEVMQSLEKDW